jgi:hypothetical protein
MKLLTDVIRAQLIANGRARDPVRGTEDEIDFTPIVKLFNPCGAGTWLLTELDPEAPDIASGLCDFGMGTPEIGNVAISELESVRGPLGPGIERDLHWKPRTTSIGYARATCPRGTRRWWNFSPAEIACRGPASSSFRPVLARDGRRQRPACRARGGEARGRCCR